MAFPTLTNPDWLENSTREELESLLIQINGYFGVQHKSDGTHGDVTATTVTTTSNVTVGGDLTVTDDATITDDLTVSGDATITGEVKLSSGLAYAAEDAVLSGGVSADLSSYGLTASAPVVLRLTTAGSGDVITGIPTSASTYPAGITGRFHYLFNDSGNTVHLAHDSGGTASFGFLTPDGLRYQFRPNEVIGLWRDETDLRWRILGAVASTASFTPVLNFGGSSAGVTYTTQSGARTRVGNLVTVEINLVLTSNGTGTGTATITGLPFAPALSVVGLVDPNAGFTLTGSPLAVIGAGSTTLTLVQTSGTGRTALTEANISDTADMRISVTYRI